MIRKIKYFPAVFIAMILLFCLNTDVFAFTGSGNGTSSNPYIITTPAQLGEVKNSLSASYKLGADLDMSGVTFTSIGSLSAYFKGEFDH